MVKTAVIFPGQGSQHIGMGKDLFDSRKEAEAVFRLAESVLGPEFVELIFNGDEEELKRTENTQPALLTVSTAVWEVLKADGLTPSYAAGHSLGEYSALTAAGAVPFAEALKAVQKRGKFMEEAVPSGEGAMAAVLGLERDALKKVTEQASAETGVVEPANYNCPGQIVISGSRAGVERAVELAKEAGARRAMMLQVSGPFHSSLMKPAAEKMKPELQFLEISEPGIPVIANVNAQPVSKEDIPGALEAQIASPVLWEDTIRYLSERGVTRFVEAGPGKVLSGLVKKIDRRAETLPVFDTETADKAKAAWGEDTE
ncbi:ACP S-malonyltransferase [Alkalicoccus urumqiensis]|uniref:Malonyl CoA-acyl carrier protein transacylase n=1 Tax=Alkalicoccus urumqiensis TaxID=1548213 RepID=A0A2P6MG77_ALKUR|nr:ACP S-malonyltransferase [Alkalicoccus urumqiensis]PRO65263.1 [acyl-carrier-protein] S-malonyltransferase [Alkalicoccus urumqiensis]